MSRPRPAGPCRGRLPGPYKEKLLALPAFLSTGGLPSDDDQLRKGLDLTGYFLERHVFWPHNKPLPPARSRFMETLNARNNNGGGSNRRPFLPLQALTSRSMAKRNNVVPLAAVKPVQFGQALRERYLSYALSTIMARSLPDVRDGLKPVHRRLLYAMRQLRLDPNSAFKKSARVVGDVIGQYHPHGDQSIYDALVRLAQEFAVRYPLIEGQGNFGNIDGDNPAAMRYTEARLTEVAEALLAGIDENAVDFRPNYDGSTEEPIVLPGGLSQPAGQWRGRHRRRHGVLDPAAQCRRAVRRAAAPDQDAQRPHRHPGRPGQGAGFSDRRRAGRAARVDRSRPTRPAAAPSGCARATRSKSCRAASTASSSPRFPTRSRRAS